MSMRGNKGELSCRAGASRKSSSLLGSVCLSVSLTHSQMHMHSRLSSYSRVCASFSSPTSSPVSPSSLSLSVAAVLVMAVCPWCKLAVGSQVAHMTVIDVQVFNSSHTETLEPHTNTNTHMQIQIHTEAQCTCMHSSVVHMHTQNTYK